MKKTKITITYNEYNDEFFEDLTVLIKPKRLKTKARKEMLVSVLKYCAGMIEVKDLK